MHVLNDFSTITWDLGRGLDLGFFTLRYYSLLFASGFILGYYIMRGMFKQAGVAQEKLDTLLTYVVVATVVGARLGHVFFYQWDYYRQHPVEIFKVWEGGLASHGAVIAIIIAIIIYSRKVLKKPTLWMLDRLVITIALAGCMIRLGNFANSEIYGDIGNSKMETVFTNPVREQIFRHYDKYIQSVDFNALEGEYITDSVIYPMYALELQFDESIAQAKQAEQVVLGSLKPLLERTRRENKNLLITGDRLEWVEGQPRTARVEAIGVPRAPTQLYEAFAYLMIFFILMRVFQNPRWAARQGLIFGLFLILIFGFRFGIEFLKENQVAAEQGRDLNIGQMLSIPLVVIGLFFVFRAKAPKDVK